MSEEYTLKTFKELQEGDLIPGTNGPTMVTKGYDTHIPDEMFRLSFEDDNGELKTIDASGNHLWYVESSIDKSMHSSRLRDGLKVLKYLHPSTIENLSDIALNGSDHETGLIDMIELLKAHGDERIKNLLIRVAESIGPVSEENTILEDLYSGEKMTSSNSRLYDASLFSQQVLALGNRKIRKRWPVIVGQVMTTSQLANLSFDINIPVVKPLGK